MTDASGGARPVGASDWPLASARFTCDGCGIGASTVTLLAPRATDPLSPPGTPGALLHTMFPDNVRLAVDGPLPMTHTIFPARKIDIGALHAAIVAGDVDALYAIDPEFAAFRCRDCAKNYCKACWRTWVTFADDFPVWYEDTKGECPAGHIRILDD